MKLNSGSLAFNISINGGGGTPSWGTELGQGDGYRFSFVGKEDLLLGMLYKSVPVTQVFCPLGKGGSKQDEYEYVISSCFNKIYANNTAIHNQSFVLLIVKKLVGSFHVGRKTLKYNPKITYKGKTVNSECFKAIELALGIRSNGAWFIDSIDIKNQDELHFSVKVLDSENPIEFSSIEDEKKAFESASCLNITTQNNNPLQTIYFGSPGTGKSRQVKDRLKDVPEGQIFRTTFHPDSDYASFVGCYKPVCHSVTAQTCKVLDYDELVAKLKQTLGEHSSNLTAGFALFGFECRESILDMEKSGEHTISKLVEDAYKPHMTYDTTIRAGMQIKEETVLPESSRISYEFSPQVFTKAYCKAWKNPDKPIYLIIEEINRGNCAQIFGDLFQLLDRKDGVSEYPIDADTDLRFYLEEELSNTEDGETDGSEGIEGGKLRLPSNFNIVATMNTSDQSLFPMDSAFKRRWDWKYIPTTAPKGKDRQMELTIKNSIETKDGRKINAGNYEYSWKDFLSNINSRILNVTHSEDKQLGYWFVKADEVSGSISISTFVSKVVFYLWNDVFKDVGAKDTNPFTIKVNGKNEIMSFNSFFEENTEGKVVESLGVLHTFLANVGLTPEPVLMEKSETDGGSENGNEDQSGSE